jgi:hypothetical protein
VIEENVPFRHTINETDIGEQPASRFERSAAITDMGLNGANPSRTRLDPADAEMRKPEFQSA